jgi:hypothetical protein
LKQISDTSLFKGGIFNNFQSKVYSDLKIIKA